jgi:phosphoglucosamine mutase
MAKQLFGTDGIRGVAGEPPLDPKTVSAFGLALGTDVLEAHGGGYVIIAMDTRESGPAIAAQVAGGLAEKGIHTRFAGVLTTPGVAYLTRLGAAAGVMISASHNPFQDNGLKVFDTSGYKLPDDEEMLIEEEIFRLLPAGNTYSLPLQVDTSLTSPYIDFLLSTLSGDLRGMHLVLDCGNGAASHLAPDLFRRAGARVTVINNEPDGRNINLNCGALHVEGLAERVVREGASGGVAFDGDADRAIFIAASGQVVNGDAVMLIAARSLKQRGKLPNDLIVSTVMSNLGLEKALERDGIRMLRTPVGDKYVLEEMLRSGAALGGEQSGHMIFQQYATTGDGMLTALQIFSIAQQSGRTLEELTSDLLIYPQKLVNVRVKARRPLEELEGVRAEIAACEKELNGDGRILVRFSGTEPLARVMVEGTNMSKVDDYSQRIAAVIQSALG